MPMPDSLKGRPIKINFISIMRKAQRAVGSRGVQGLPPARWAAYKAYRRYGDLNDLDKDLWFTLDEVQEHDQAREQAKAQAQAPQDAMAAVTAAKSLSETPLNQGTMLSSLLGRSPA
jgi:hypothetical protein